MEIPFNKLQLELIQNVSFWLETVFNKDKQ